MHIDSQIGPGPLTFRTDVVRSLRWCPVACEGILHTPEELPQMHALSFQVQPLFTCAFVLEDLFVTPLPMYAEECMCNGSQYESTTLLRAI